MFDFTAPGGQGYLQNGPNDGIALVIQNDNTVLEFLSWEGVITGGNGVANGVTSTDIGVNQTSAAVGLSLQRQVGSTLWFPNQPSTKGSVNADPKATKAPTKAPTNAPTKAPIKLQIRVCALK